VLIEIQYIYDLLSIFVNLLFYTIVRDFIAWHIKIVQTTKLHFPISSFF